MSPFSLLLLQIVAVVAVTRACAAALRRLGQPAVIGEILGGIVLGPSVLGRCWPAAEAALFPPGSLGGLGVLSQVGLVAFMFVVGLELDLGALGRKARSAVFVSHASIVAPFLLGALLALRLHPAYGPAGVPRSAFCLFMGVAMSVTAFPVLARIIQDRKLGPTPLGALALACAAVDDLTAWCALAVVVAIVRQGSVASALGLASLSVAYVVGMLLLARPALAALLGGRSPEEQRGAWVPATALLVMLASAFVTERLGIHALFGAFLAGVAMPQDAVLRQGLVRRLRDFAALLLLPLFFALSGLRTELGLLSDARSWLVCALVVLVAVTGKLGAGALAARWSGNPWRESLALGALMNARGLVELVVLNIGYDLGVITPAVFTMMVLMALITTLMTGPLLEVFVPDLLRQADPERRTRLRS